MLTFATIHDPLHLVRACRDLSDLSAFGRGRGAYGEPDELLGLWLEPPSPSALRLAHSRGRERPPADGGPPLLGSVGVSGLWTLSWLAEEWDRLALLDALVAQARPRRFALPRGQFVAVFPSSLDERTLQDTMAQLRRRHPRHVSPPMLQRADTGALIMPPTARWSRGAVAASSP